MGGNYHKKKGYLDPTRIIVVVEGNKREKQYFNWFAQQAKRISIVVLEPKREYDKEGNMIDHEGNSSPKWSLPRLERFVKENDIREFDQVWLVYDQEHFTSVKDIEELQENLDKSELKSKHRNIVISDPCFEIWLALHVTELPKDKDFKDCETVKQWLAAYTLGGFNTKFMHVNSITIAIKRSEEIYASAESMTARTNIHLLAKELLAALRKY